jgi:D-glycero-alpha-D-manno-heptose-7-phosphate kinase
MTFKTCNIVRARAPLRLGLGGGGSDVAPYCGIYGGYVLNVTIDRYAYAVIKSLAKPNVHFVDTDQRNEETLEINVPLNLNGKLALHKAHIVRR